MRTKLLILISLLFPVLAFGQSYTYDGAGNRTGRSSGFDPGIIAPPIGPVNPGILGGADGGAQTQGFPGAWMLNDAGSGEQLPGTGVGAMSISSRHFRVRRVDSAPAEEYAVGMVPHEVSVSPTGGRTVSVPIRTSPCRYAPSISLAYNSQGGDGPAGYGWEIAGLSAIALSPKTMYYDGEVSAPDPSDPSHQVFSLDGNRLIGFYDDADFSDYEYRTVRGEIYIDKLLSGGEISHFKALRPDGSTDTYGYASNDTTRLSYPLTKSTDHLGHTILYDYIFEGNRYYVSRIRYGGRTEGQLPCEIEFKYSEKPRRRSGYVGGVEVGLTKILDTVITRNDGLLVGKYILEHGTLNGTSVVSRIYYESYTGERLRPLVFAYGGDGAEEGLTPETVSTVSSPYPVSGTAPLSHLRGHFLRDSHSDGMISMLEYPTYALLSEDDGEIFGSPYPASQQIFIHPSLGESPTYSSIPAGAGFQTLGAADVDGNGSDEVVKVNFGTFDAGHSTLDITVYSFTAPGTYGTRTFSVEAGGKAVSYSPEDSHPIYSPMGRIYRFGDFLGSGKMQLLTVSYRMDAIGGNDQTPRVCLIDLESGSLISGTDLGLNLYEGNGNLFPALDIDGDGVTELIDSGTGNVYSFSPSGTLFLERSGALPPSALTNDRAVLGDINADGLVDILVPPAPSAVTYTTYYIPTWAPHYCPFCDALEPGSVSVGFDLCPACSGNIRSYFNRHPEMARCHACGRHLDILNTEEEDENVDKEFSCPEHREEYLATVAEDIPDSAYTWMVHVNTGKGFVTSSQQIIRVDEGDSFQMLDMNRDGYQDLLRIGSGGGYRTWLYVNDGGRIRTAPGGETANLSSDARFLSMLQMNAYRATHLVVIDGSRVSAISCGDIDRNLLTAMTDSYGLRTESAYASAYDPEGCYSPSSAVRAYPFSETFLPLVLLEGGRKKTGGQVVESLRYSYSGSTVSLDGRGFMGFASTSVTDSLRSRVSATEYDPLLGGVPVRVTAPGSVSEYAFSRIVEPNLEEKVLLTSSVEKDLLTGVWTTTSYLYDEHGYPESVETGKAFGNGSPSYMERTLIEYDHHDDTPSPYALGTVLCRTRLSSADSTSTLSLKEKEETVSFYRDLLPSKVRHYVGRKGYDQEAEAQVDEDNLLEEVLLTYDVYGNVLTRTVACYGATAYHQTSYADEDGRYLSSETSPLSLTTTYGSFDRFGNALTVTDPHGNVTTRAYDSFGTLVSTIRPDGSEESVTASWGGKDCFAVETVGNSSPSTLRHFDALGRETRSEVQRFDGQWMKRDTGYDSFGRKERVSLPYRDTAATHWTLYSYDSFDRPTRIEEPSGKLSHWSYNGPSVQTVKDGITSLRTYDPAGNLIAAADSGGVITYAIRYDGQIASITAPDSLVTSFTYDAYGRRASITDPSAGLRTTAYTHYPGGGQKLLETNPKGSVETTYDRYGRVTGVTRSGSGGFSTTYAYDSFGRIRSELSTSGAGKLYTYDSLDRPVSVKEVVPDGHWVQTGYTYDSSGRLSETEYSDEEEVIAREMYSYSYGNLSSVRKDSTVTIWSLQAENDFGQPTEIVTDTLLRQYGYSVYGLPTYRRIAGGAIQDFEYGFDPLTGNLLRRRDNNQSSSWEEFTYDSLDRLISAGGQEVTYALNGNLVGRGTDETMTYGTGDHSYQVTGYSATILPLSSINSQSISYTSYDRPLQISESSIRPSTSKTARFTYGSDGERVRMVVTNSADTLLTRYYIGERYERDEAVRETVKRLYLGGDAYSAPMVLCKVSGSWKVYQIGRDHLGSITQIIDEDGEVIEENSYDPWGRLRDADNLLPYAVDTDTGLFLGSGYTGHEHLPWFGLINMNARLYDPLVGRFLSPDPYIQAPDFTQNFNRYSYALNNPLKYTDPSGNFFVIDSFVIGLIGGGWKRAKQMAGNDIKIWGGLFNVDKNKSIPGQAWELVSRFTWQLPQTTIGFLLNQTVNTFRIGGGIEKVDYLHGATVSKHHNDKWGGFTFGSYILGDNSIEARDDNDLFQHEFGHYLQSQEFGLLWLFGFAVESGISAIANDYYRHNAFYTEQDANARSLKYFVKYYGESYAQTIWDFGSNPITGYDKTKTYRDNLSIIKRKIIPFIISFRKKDAIGESVIIDQYHDLPEIDYIIL